MFNKGLSKKRRGVLKRVLKSERKEGGGGSERDEGRGTLNLSNLLFFPSLLLLFKNFLEEEKYLDYVCFFFSYLCRT